MNNCNILLVFVGSGIGGIARYTLSSVSFIPYPLVFINFFGSLIIGFVFYLAVKESEFYLFFTAGILGGFTTFSGFSLDILKYINNNQFSLAFLYAITSVFLSIFAVFIGYYFGYIITKYV